MSTWKRNGNPRECKDLSASEDVIAKRAAEIKWELELAPDAQNGILSLRRLVENPIHVAQSMQGVPV